MKVSRNQLANYSLDSDKFFPTRIDRNNYWNNGLPETGTYCAVAEDPNVPMDDMTTPYWYLEQFNGVNWTLVSIDDSFALVVTNEGLKALTYAEGGIYKLKISRVVIRKTSLPSGANIINYNDTLFRYNANTSTGNRSLVVLDTKDGEPGGINTSFSMKKNVSYRINMSNGGIQYIILLDVDTIGVDYANSNTSSNIIIQKESFSVGAIGLYVEDPHNDGNEILFAVGNIANPIYKYATTATKVGNSVKLYLNTTLSNLGYVSDLTVMPEDRGSLPEVVTEGDLPKTWNALTTPHNVFLIDNLYSTGVPALAVRKGNPIEPETPLEWTYFSPSNNTIEIRPEDIQGVQDYMAVYYDGTKYVPALGTQGTQGIKVGNSIIYDGLIVNNKQAFNYIVKLVDTARGSHYTVGDKFRFVAKDVNNNDITFEFVITETTSSTGAVQKITFYPQGGSEKILQQEISQFQPINVTNVNASGLKLTVLSDKVSSAIDWDFSAWINKPLYVSNDNAGYLTDQVTETFVGWCIDAHTIKLSLDLRKEATYTKYGTTRYATNEEVNSLNNVSKSTTAVNPDTLKHNYFQTTIPGTISEDNIDYDGSTRAKAIRVKTYTQFEKTIVGNGNDVDGVSFKGTAYRALWGDLAEFYRADRVYLPGTLITIGAGKEEIKEADVECNGIISDKPGYTLGDKKDEYDLPVALVGKVPVRFSKDSDPEFGDRIYLSKTEPGKASVIPNGKCLGKIIDKDKDLHRKSTILCSVRINF